MSTPSKSQNITVNKKALGTWIASGWVFFFFVLFVTWALIPDDLTSGVETLSARFVFSLSHLFLASLILFIGFLAVGATRWKIETKDTAANPATSGGQTADTNIHSRVHAQFLTNTTEQFVMFAASLLAATPFLTQSYLRIVTLMTVLWIFGRLFFWGGYWYTACRDLPTYPRAIGLGMGLLCTLVMAAIAAVGISLHFPSFNLDIPSLSTLSASTGFSFSDMVIRPDGAVQGSNLLPVGFISVLVAMIAGIAIYPRIAPPVVPLALIAVIGWSWLLLSGTVPVR